MFNCPWMTRGEMGGYFAGHGKYNILRKENDRHFMNLESQNNRVDILHALPVTFQPSFRESLEDIGSLEGKVNDDGIQMTTWSMSRLVEGMYIVTFEELERSTSLIKEKL
jgi:hypothetical protein